MVVSSFLVLLTMRYVFALMAWYTRVTDYYQAYYLARGGMDILLTQHAYRWWWYETTFTTTGHDFLCGAQSCQIQAQIISRFPRIDASIAPTTAQCTQTQAIRIQPNTTVLFPLFRDAGGVWQEVTAQGNFQDMLSSSAPFTPLIPENDYKAFPTPPWLHHISLFIYDNPSTGDISLYDSFAHPFGTTTGIATFPLGAPHIDEQGQSYHVEQHFLATYASKKGQYLLIHNPPTGNDFGICFAADAPDVLLPMIGQTTLLRSYATIHDTHVRLETVKTNRFPSILVQ